MRLLDIEKLCVLSFVEKRVRERLYYAFEELVQRLLRLSINCEILCNGSFLTESIEPHDVDIVVRIDADVAEALSEEQRALVEAISGDEPYLAGVDSFVEVAFPRDHPSYRLDSDISWEAMYGLEHSERWLKGIAVLRLGETDVGLRFRR